MNSSCFRTIGLALLALFTSAGLRAESFTGATFVDFDARGYTNYDIYLYADVVVGGSLYSSAYASFGGLSGSSFSYYGESGVAMQLSNVHKVSGQWTADSVTTSIFSNDTGAWETSYAYNVILSSSSWIDGNAECNGYSQTVRGSINGSGGYSGVLNFRSVRALAALDRSSGEDLPPETEAALPVSLRSPVIASSRRSALT